MTLLGAVLWSLLRNSFNVAQICWLRMKMVTRLLISSLVGEGDREREGNDEVEDYILTVAYKGQVLEREGNRVIHSILEVAEHRCFVEDNSEEEDGDEESVQQRQQTLRVCLPVGKLALAHFRSLLQSFDGNLMHHQDNTGALPLHVACRTDAPVEILELLLQEHPGAVRIADNSGSLPMHVTCQADAPSRAVLQLLLDRSPTALRARDHAGALPLHCLCASNPPVDALELLLRACHGSVAERNNNNDLPFTVACKTRASIGVCLVLLRAHPDALGDL